MKKVNTCVFFLMVCFLATRENNFAMNPMPMAFDTSITKLFDTLIKPPNYDDIDQPALRCDQRLDKNFNIYPYLLNSPNCVGGQILDSTFWLAHPGEPDEYPKRRLPKVLGWNYIADTSNTYFGLPNPDTIFYPQHSSWSPNDPLCWGPNQYIMGLGTGRPYSPDCSHLEISYSDKIINFSNPDCNSNLSTCFKILRTWAVYDSCNPSYEFVIQIIKVSDIKGPTVLYPDSLIVNIESQHCKGKWEVSPAWLLDNCSSELHYKVEVDDGIVLGNEISGYVVVNLSPGLHIAYIEANDCCGNITRQKVILSVVKNVPPNAVCESNITLSIVGNSPPGQNFAILSAEDFRTGITDTCTPLFLKIIRMDKLKNTNNGSNNDQGSDNTNCAAINGDDNVNLDGNQIYFDDRVKYCCSDVGRTLVVVLRVFDVDPGIGPVDPASMNKGGFLFNHFSDCTTTIEVQDKSIPSLVSPPNIVVSCAFPFDIKNLENPNDSTFGRVVTDLSFRGKVSTIDKVCYNYCVKNDKTGYPGYEIGAPPSNPPAWNRACDYYKSLFDTTHVDSTYKLVWGFDGYSLTACDNSPSIEVTDKRICGQGQIARKITVSGPNGIQVSATQMIWVVDCDPFYINRNDYCDPDDDIIWPGNCNGQATIISNCSADRSPDNPLLGKPIINQNAANKCSLIAINYTDVIMTTIPDTCFQIARNWEVTDWCQYDPSIDSLNGKWKYVQEIKIVNFVSTKDKQRTKNEIIVMPNPSHGEIIVKSEMEIDNIKLISCLGRTNSNFNVTNKHSIELYGISSGVYFVQAYFRGRQVAVAKFIIID